MSESYSSPATLIAFLGGLTRRGKIALQVACDTAILVSSFYLAIFLRTESFERVAEASVLVAIIVAVFVALAGFSIVGLYRLKVRFVVSKSLLRTPLVVAMAGATLYAWQTNTGGLLLPRSVPIIFTASASLGIWISRFSARGLFLGNLDSGSAPRKNIIIYGAGAAGSGLASALAENRTYKVLAFVDDDPSLQGIMISGYRVYAPDVILKLTKKYYVEQILIATPSASDAERAGIIRKSLTANVPVKTIPSFDKIMSGSARLDEFAEIQPEELLGREPVEPDAGLIDETVSGRMILVTGAGGSIGSELCRQALKYEPKSLILFDHSEYNLYQIERELVSLASSNTEIIPILGSVSDPHDVSAVFASHRIDSVIHAAAYKHVPLVETNVVKAYANNCLGTKTVAEEAIKNKVSKFILVSTDKAVRPTNFMGATKRVAELICLELSAAQSDTEFTVVRFGNVLGSSGSVIPLFKEQIKRGGPVTVTHPDVTRYFMTTPEAAQLILQAGALRSQDRVFVLDMKDPIKIADLAADMIRLSGKVPALPSRHISQQMEGSLPIVFTGLRAGEKLYEELSVSGNLRNTPHPSIWFEPCRSSQRETVTLIDSINPLNELDVVNLLKLSAEIIEQPDDQLTTKAGKLGGFDIPRSRLLVSDCNTATLISTPMSHGEN